MTTEPANQPPQPSPASPAETNPHHPPQKPSWNPLKRLYHWVLHWAETPYGTPALAAISFIESSFFPIPPDVLQIALSVSKPRRSYYYAAVSAVASVAGGIFGYFIGYAFWSAVGPFFQSSVPGFTKENLDFVEQQYQSNAFWAIFIAAFTPVPYKVFTISAGMFQIPLWTLIIASALGRSGRFFLVATAIFFAGPQVKALLEKYLELVTIVLGVLLIGGFVAIKYLM